MKVSLILPLYDRRDAGCEQLRSALGQSVDRSSYEVVVVVGRLPGAPPAVDAQEAELLRECDAVVDFAGDPNRPDLEIPMLLAGYARSTGDVLFFMEGHTVLDRNCCAMIAAHFRDNPGSRIGWAPRVHRNATSLGSLIEQHSRVHERLAHTRGGFWLGANSFVSRDLFEEMGRLDPNYLRYSERAFLERVVRAKVEIGTLSAPLATHHDDMTFAQLVAVADAAGQGKFKYYNSAGTGADSNPVRVRHWIYLLANRDASALILLPLALALGNTLLRVAIGLRRFNAGLAYRLFVPGLGFRDLSGFCSARIRAGRAARHARLNLASSRAK
ncbi:MAG TPA: glycosyltransferase family 2 protein [Casimicrobiaceae bacterium]|nr:glycosyltransferase family 2 protein [Casimicrobiaceae bacterium]